MFAWIHTCLSDAQFDRKIDDFNWHFILYDILYYIINVFYILNRISSAWVCKKFGSSLCHLKLRRFWHLGASLDAGLSNREVASHNKMSLYLFKMNLCQIYDSAFLPKSKKVLKNLTAAGFFVSRFMTFGSLSIAIWCPLRLKPSPDWSSKIWLLRINKIKKLPTTQINLT